MNIMTATTEIGIVLCEDGRYEVALYRRAENRMIRFPVDAALAWAIGGSLHTPITAEPVLSAP